MAVTYDGDLSSDRDKVRFHIQDTIRDAGPKPNDSNFTDAEIEGLISLEGSWQRAVAAALEALTALWARHPDYTIEGLSNRWGAADKFEALAKDWRDKYGYGVASTVVSRPVIRTDAYSDDLNSVETT